VELWAFIASDPGPLLAALRLTTDWSAIVSCLNWVKRSFREGGSVPERETLRRAHKDAQEGKAPSTQAGEFVREEIHHVREGKHGVRNPKQAIAIGLSKARKGGVRLPPPKGSASAKKEGRRHRSAKRRPSTKRSRATTRALKRERHSGASPRALSRHARTAARRRGATRRSQAARKAARTRKSSRSRR